VSCGRGCIVTTSRSMVCAFGDDGERLHLGDERVVARKRRSLDGQVIGTGFPHDRCRRPAPGAVRDVVLGMVEAALPTRLMARLRGSCRLPAALVLAVDVAAVVGRTAIEDPATASASDRDQDFGVVHGGANALGT